MQKIQDDTVPSPHEHRRELASNLAATLRALMSNAGERALESGRLFRRVRDEKLFEDLGYAAFEDYVKAEGFKRATAYGNMKLAGMFGPCDLPLGISKLRLLANAKVADARALIENGIPGADGTPNRPLRELTHRELAEWVRALPDASPAATPIGLATHAATACLFGPNEPIAA